MNSREPEEAIVKETERELTLVLHCRNLPGTQCAGKTGVRIGVQKGQVVIEDVPADTEEALFTLPLHVRSSSQTGQSDYRGPFVQGRVGERFVYLCWGERVGPTWEGFRRAKLPLRHLGAGLVQKALSTGIPIHVFLDMTDERGGPLTACIKEEVIVWRLDETGAA
jgi:hypothetical protein